MRKTIAKVTGLVAACVCVFAMILVSFIVPRSAAADDGTSSTGFTVPSFCGKNNVIMLTSTGQVYQVFTPQPQLPATGDSGEYGGHVSGACMFPLPYLPMWDPRVTYTFDALASDNKTGDLWAVINTGTGNSIKMQAWRLTKADRIRYANYPNPYNSVMTYWKRVNQPMPIGNGMATGGAVDNEFTDPMGEGKKGVACYRTYSDDMDHLGDPIDVQDSSSTGSSAAGSAVVVGIDSQGRLELTFSKENVPANTVVTCLVPFTQTQFTLPFTGKSFPWTVVAGLALLVIGLAGTTVVLMRRH